MHNRIIRGGPLNGQRKITDLKKQKIDIFYIDETWINTDLTVAKTWQVTNISLSVTWVTLRHLRLTRSIVHPLKLIGLFQLVSQPTNMMQLTKSPRSDFLISAGGSQYQPNLNRLKKMRAQGNYILDSLIFLLAQPADCEF